MLLFYPQCTQDAYILPRRLVCVGGGGYILLAHLKGHRYTGKKGHPTLISGKRKGESSISLLCYDGWSTVILQALEAVLLAAGRSPATVVENKVDQMTHTSIFSALP